MKPFHQLVLITILTCTAAAASDDGGSISLQAIIITDEEANKYLAAPRRKLEVGSSENCPPGKWWEEEFWGDECHNCPTGQYQNQYATSRSCKHCPTGQYQNSNGQKYPLRSQVRRGKNVKQYAAQYLQAQLIFSHTANHIFRPNGSKETIDSVLKSQVGLLWDISLSNE